MRHGNDNKIHLLEDCLLCLCRNQRAHSGAEIQAPAKVRQ